MTPYRSFALLCVAICALTSACAADRGSQATTEPVEFSQDAGRHLLQGRGGTGSGAGVGSGSGTPSGQRLFSEVAAHKQPNTPKLTRKTFERQVPSGRHLLQGRGGTGSGAGVGSGSGTPSGQRLFSEVAAHKQPNTPKLTRKTFERQVPSGRKAV